MTASKLYPGSAGAAPGGSLLGIYAECSSGPSKSITCENRPSSEIDPKTGEVKGEAWSHSAALVERYALQSQARRSMLEAWRKDGSDGKPHKVTRCRRWLRPRGFVKAYAEVYRHRDTRRAFFTGTEVCGNPWACPVCSAKIAERRCQEIQRALAQWYASGGIVLFVTLTFPHTRFDRLSLMVQRFRQALERLRSGRAAAAMNARLGRVGLIRALEVKWSALNGWHPHSHEIWFCRPGDELHRAFLDAKAKARESFIRTGKKGITPGAAWDLHCEIYQMWKPAVLAAGLGEPSLQHGVSVDVAETEEEARSRLAEYLAKSGLERDPSQPVWGVDDEMTKAHSKRGGGRSDKRRFTPFDFLHAQFDVEVSVGDRIAHRERFAEYVQAFKGMPQVFWSRGLKARFEIEDKSDQQTAEESREGADSLSRIDFEDWARLFVRTDHRATLLLLAQHGGPDVIREFLDSLPPASFDSS